MYVAYEATVLKYNLEKGSFQAILDIPAGGTIDTIFTDDDLLLLLGKGINGMDANLTIVDRNSSQVIDSASNLQWYARHLYGASISKQNNRIYGKTSGISSSDIAFWTYSDNGTLLSYEESTYYQDFSDAEKVWVFPANRRVVDEAGIVFDALTLSYLSSFALPDFIIDIDWIDGLPIAVHSEHKFTLFNDTTLLPILVAESDVSHGAVLNIMANNVISTVSIFRSNDNSTNGIEVEVISIADFISPEPIARDLDPANLTWSPDDSFVGPNDVLHFLSKEHEAIFRWDANSYNYGSTIHLFGSPQYVAYSQQTGTIYTVYEETRLIMKIKDDLEEPFATLPASPTGLVTAGQYLFAVTSENLFTVFYTFDSGGNLISSERGESSLDYVWNNSTQRIYYFRNDFDPGDMSWIQINSNGELGEKMKSGLQDSRYMHPILIHPHANYVLLGSGQFYDADTFERLNFTLPSSFDEGISSENGLLILRSSEEGFGTLEKWSNDIALLMTTRIDRNYNVKALLQTSNGRYVIALNSAVNGSPLFLVFEESLQTIYEPETRYTLSPSAAPSPIVSSGTPTNLESNYTLYPHSGPPSYQITPAPSKQPSNTFVPSVTPSPIVSSGTPTNLESNYTLHPHSGPPSYQITSPPIEHQPSDCTGTEVLLNVTLIENFEAEWILYDDCDDFTFIANKTSSVTCVPRSKYLFMIEALSGPGNFTLLYDNKFIHFNETIDVGKRFLFGEDNCRNHTDNISPSSAPSANFRCASNETNINITIGNVSIGGNDDNDEMKWQINAGCGLSYASVETGSGSMSACIPRDILS
ncbi:hypothetical protein CTEN210_13936 [Chaetoceros tenuissimus]|uniref:Uncharacterized protein n=1 Tax=Chaetoceros tenuissimus TaxID=426638 RepID=A0AAD3D6K2_9STRA|nr:hypothetical protein CTEN210_13936 [Chaetoceros tenuissimus]